MLVLIHYYSKNKANFSPKSLISESFYSISNYAVLLCMTYTKVMSRTSRLSTRGGWLQVGTDFYTWGKEKGELEKGQDWWEEIEWGDPHTILHVIPHTPSYQTLPKSYQPSISQMNGVGAEWKPFLISKKLRIEKDSISVTASLRWYFFLPLWAIRVS